MANSGSKADTAFKLVLIFFISLLSFSVGTYVGKQVSDSDYRRASLEADFNGRSETADNKEDGAAATDEATKPVNQEESASLSEEFIKGQRKPSSAEADKTADVKADEGAEHAQVPAPEHAANDGYTHRSKVKGEIAEKMAMNERSTAAVSTTAPAASGDASTSPAAAAGAAKTDTAVKGAADRVSNDQAPAADVKKAAPKSTALPTVATTAVGKYTVQIASYATEGEAKDRASLLTEKGYSAFYIPAVVNGKNWYRVSVGLFSDQKSATNYRTELLSTKVVETAIVQKIVK
jgi:cell division protein FtsN